MIKMTYKITHDKKTDIHYITVHQKNHTVTFVDFGARIQEWHVPNKDDVKENILLSPDTPEEILNDSAQFGALVGPVAGRIKEGKWNGLQFEKNNGNNHLHGGSNGWWHQFWSFDIEEVDDDIIVHFMLKDTMTEYPGPIYVRNSYRVTQDSIEMTTSCHSDSNTIVNPTNHIYFNLNGNAKDDITNHTLLIHADNILETDDENIPTGKLIDVTNTGYDFRSGSLLKDSLNILSSGIDDAFLLSNEQPQIILSQKSNGRQIQISSNRQAAVIFSTTNFATDQFVTGQKMRSQLGIAIETQELPDVVNHPTLGNIDLDKHQVKTWKTAYKYTII